MPSTTYRADGAGAPLRPLTWRSALKRALLGVIILAATMGGVAWLTYASIEPEPGQTAKTVKPQRAPADGKAHLFAPRSRSRNSSFAFLDG